MKKILAYIGQCIIRFFRFIFLMDPPKNLPSQKAPISVPIILENIPHIEYLKTIEIKDVEAGYEHTLFQDVFKGYADPLLVLTNYTQGGARYKEDIFLTAIGAHLEVELDGTGEIMEDERTLPRQVAICTTSDVINIETILGQRFDEFALTNKKQILEVVKNHRTELFDNNEKVSVFPYVNLKTKKRFLLLVTEDPGSFEVSKEIRFPSLLIRVAGKCLGKQPAIEMGARLYLGL